MVERIIPIQILSLNSNVVSERNQLEPFIQIFRKYFRTTFVSESPFLDLEATIYHKL